VEKRWSYTHKDEIIANDFVPEEQCRKDASTGTKDLSSLLISAIFDPALAYEVSTLRMNLICSGLRKVLQKRKAHGNEYEEKVNYKIKNKLIQPQLDGLDHQDENFALTKDIIFHSKIEQRWLPLEFRSDILP